MNKKYEKLFEPMNIGKLLLKNRIVFSPIHTRFFVGNDYTYNYWHKEYFRDIAKGGVGLIITGETKTEYKIDPYPVNSCMPVIDSDQRIKEFADIAETVHHYGAKIVAQLTPGVGRLADAPQADRWPAAPSKQPLFFHPDLMTKELSKTEIMSLVQSFGEAADRLKRAGFDALFINAHNYLIDQFLSECWNHRTDEYGGSMENRMRFFAECLENARGYIGKDFPVITGLALEHGFEGGRTLAQSIDIAKTMKNSGVDAFYVRDGSYDAINVGMPNAFSKDGMVLVNAEKFKKKVKTITITGQQIGEPDECEKAIMEDKVDFIGLGRALLSDAQWPNKVSRGRTEDIRPCIRCMECIDRYSKDKYIGCAVNPRLGRERDFPVMQAFPVKKILVIGGGPAGMEAARIAAGRGHEVTLIDKNPNLGGLLRTAAVPDYKYRIKIFTAWLERQTENAGVKIQRGTEVTPEMVKKMKPDVIIVAAGAKPFIPDIPGIESKNVVHAIDVLNKEAKVGEVIVIIGGRWVSWETAYCLAKAGKQVDMVVRSALLPDESIFNKYTMLDELPKYDVTIHLKWQPAEIRNNGVIIRNEEGNEKFLEADTVIVGTGFISDHSIYKSLEGLAEEVYEIGDSVSPRRIYDAVHEGYLTGKEI